METLHLVLNDTEVKVETLNANSEDAINKITKQMKNLKELHGPITLKMNTIIVQAFNLYQRMFPPVLHVKWDGIEDEI